MKNKNLLTLALILPLFASCGKQTAVTDDTAASGLMLTDSLRKVITIDTVHEAGLNNELLLNGRVTFDAAQLARVYPMFGGTITDVKAEVGDYVSKGSVLAAIRSSEVADIEKQRKEVAHQVLLANRNLEASRDMFRSGMASERDLLQSEQEAETARAEQKRLDEVYAICNIRDNSVYEITSPVSGFVIDKNISRNMQIRPDQSDELFTVSGLSDVWVMADVYESDIHRIGQGAEVRITTLAYGPDKTFTGVIDKVYNLLDDESKTMKVRIKLNNKDYMLKPGMFTNVYVQCKVDGKVMPRIPTHALIFEGGKQYVVGIGSDGYLQTKEVSVYKQTERYCYLDAGVQDGELIVNNNALLVFNALK